MTPTNDVLVLQALPTVVVVPPCLVIEDRELLRLLQISRTLQSGEARLILRMLIPRRVRSTELHLVNWQRTSVGVTALVIYLLETCSIGPEVDFPPDTAT